MSTKKKSTTQKLTKLDNIIFNSRILLQLPLSLIQRSPYQPRIEFDQTALLELATSIRQQGVVQPIVVRSQVSGSYELIAGERRYRAAILAGLSEIPAVVHDTDDKNAAALAMIENMQREDLNPIEIANSLQRLAKEFSLTHEQLADIVSKSRTEVTNLMRLLNLDIEVKEFVLKKQIDMGHARALLPLKALQQRELAKRIIEEQLSVRDTERLVREMTEVKKPKPLPIPDLEPRMRKYQEDLSEKLKAKIELRHGHRKGNGQCVIHYNTIDEFQEILKRVGIHELETLI